MQNKTVKQPQRPAKNSNGINALFEPGSIAVVGSLREGRFGGYRVISQPVEE